MSIERIVVVGAGTMGNGIAHVAALHDRDVTLVDVDPEALERALASVEKNLGRQVDKGVIEPDRKPTTLDRISTGT
ncbi:MAG: 3-hydroxyacyl-CoA dehydrogenase NAD-binding domain-containing protein, partial [Gemmatimonadota bacterium]